MWFVYILLGLLALILLVVLALMLIPVRCRIAYDGEPEARIWVLGESMSLLPEEEKKDTFLKKQIKKTTLVKTLSKTEELIELLREDSLMGTVKFIKDAVVLLGRALGRILRSVKVTYLKVHMLVAAGDPADTAQLYGQVCSVLYPFLAIVGKKVRLRRRDIRVEPNFLLESGEAQFDIRLRMSLARLLCVLIALMWGFVVLDEEDLPQNYKEVI